MLWLDPIDDAKTASRLERHRSVFVMVRLDRTIGVPKIALTGVFVLMVRSSRTMTMEGRYHIARSAILALLGLDPSNRGGIPARNIGQGA
jgi:hypothetical protein